MNIIPINKVSLSGLVTKVIIAFQDIKGIIFDKSTVLTTSPAGGQISEERYVEIEQAITQACSLIYPYIYLPTSKAYSIDNKFITLSEHIRSIGLITMFSGNEFEALRDIIPIPPELEVNNNWKVYIPNKYNLSEVVVFAEEECYVDNEYVYLSDEECLLKQAIYEVAKGRTLKRQTYDSAPANTDEIATSEQEMIQFTALAHEELLKTLIMKKMERITELMMLPENLGNKSVKTPAVDNNDNSYISSRG